MSTRPHNKLPRHWRILAFALASAMLLPGCAGLGGRDGAHKNGDFSIFPQWRQGDLWRAKTVEVFIDGKDGKNALPEDVQIDGMSITSFPRKPLDVEATHGLLWWKHSRLAHVGEIDRTVLTLCFADAPPPFELAVSFDGVSKKIDIPAYAPDPKAIRDIAFARNGREMFVALDADGVRPQALEIDGTLAPFQEYRDGRIDKPVVLCAKLRKRTKLGEPHFVKISFADGSVLMGHTRALTKFVLSVNDANKSDRKRLKLDAVPAVATVPYGDCGCYDLETGRIGSAATDMLAAQMHEPTKKGDFIPAILFCMGATAETFGIYGTLLDSALSAPFAALRSTTPGSLTAIEEKTLRLTAKATHPFPVLWMAPLYAFGGKIAGEDETMRTFWMAMAMGAKGVVAYPLHSGGGYTGFEDDLTLWNVWLKLHNAAKEVDRLMFPLIAIDDFTTPDGAVHIHTAWHPGRGMLVVWRSADGLPLAEDRRVPIHLPAWLKNGRISDRIDGGGTQMRRKGRGASAEITLSANKSFGAVWID